MARSDDASTPDAMLHHQITVSDDVPMVSLLGQRDEVLRAIEQGFPGVDIHVRGNVVSFSGPAGDVALAERLVDELAQVARSGQALTADAVGRAIKMLTAPTAERPADVLTFDILSARGRTIRPKTLGQKKYVDAIDEHTITFGVGPAGTGKTYLAMAKAVHALQSKRINRIVLTRPAVEAGERLGYLPGTLTDKIDPYLRPLYDALHDMLDPESIPRLMAAGTIEVAPLAYMRGRAQPVDSQVLTPTGWRRFGDQQVGDLVIGSDGRPTPVIGVYPQGRRQVFRVAAADGASTLACAEHLWTVRIDADEQDADEQDADQQDADQQVSRWRTLRTEEMTGSLGGDGDRFELPLVQAVELIEREVPMDPYVLGRLLVKGHRSASAVPALA